MKSNAVGWFEIPVENMDRAMKFYGKVFQYGDFVDLSGPEIQMFAFPWTPGAPNSAGALVKSSVHQPGMTGVLIYFSCLDCAVEAHRAAEQGGIILRERFGVGEFGFVSVIQDTEGNMIGLHSVM